MSRFEVSHKFLRTELRKHTYKGGSHKNLLANIRVLFVGTYNKSPANRGVCGVLQYAMSEIYVFLSHVDARQRHNATVYVLTQAPQHVEYSSSSWSHPDPSGHALFPRFTSLAMEQQANTWVFNRVVDISAGFPTVNYLRYRTTNRPFDGFPYGDSICSFDRSTRSAIFQYIWYTFGRWMLSHYLIARKYLSVYVAV